MDNYLTELTEEFSLQCSRLSFDFDGYVYNPLDYARANHRQYLQNYVRKGVRVLFLGMNPGPFGMLQTGVPFGEINTVRDYLKINNTVGKPAAEHPGRPVLGMNTTRSEISGLRLWSLMRDRYPDADAFADENCIMNYCPLGFLSPEKTAKNITPDKLNSSDRFALEKLCNGYLVNVIRYIGPGFLVGVGKYAENKLSCLDTGIPVAGIIHPSPGNPQANSNWAGKTLCRLTELGIWK